MTGIIQSSLRAKNDNGFRLFLVEAPGYVKALAAIFTWLI